LPQGFTSDDEGEAFATQLMGLSVSALLERPFNSFGHSDFDCRHTLHLGFEEHPDVE